jgi:hypothetical protein
VKAAPENPGVPADKRLARVQEPGLKQIILEFAHQNGEREPRPGT